LILIGDESERPYERPPLSKDYLRGESPNVPYVHPKSFYEDKNIELWTSARVTGIEPGLQELRLPNRLLVSRRPSLRLVAGLARATTADSRVASLRVSARDPCLHLHVGSLAPEFPSADRSIRFW